MSDPADACDGCTACFMRCTDGIKISEIEYTRIVEELRTQPPGRVLKVLEQSKKQHWCEGITYTACLLLDVDRRLCLVYPARPLVCRLFGRVQHLPCPEGRIAVDLDARRVIQAYVTQRLQTFQEWMVTRGVFDFVALLEHPYTPPRIEL
jgi:Fe-S-cluster containining protein